MNKPDLNKDISELTLGLKNQMDLRLAEIYAELVELETEHNGGIINDNEYNTRDEAYVTEINDLKAFHKQLVDSMNDATAKEAEAAAKSAEAAAEAAAKAAEAAAEAATEELLAMLDAAEAKKGKGKGNGKGKGKGKGGGKSRKKNKTKTKRVRKTRRTR